MNMRKTRGSWFAGIDGPSVGSFFGINDDAGGDGAVSDAVVLGVRAQMIFKVLCVYSAGNKRI